MKLEVMVMANAPTSVLSSEQISERVRSMSGWQQQGKELVKTYRFKNFVEAVDFVNAITREAEAAGHHPDLLVRWGEVTVHLSSHDAGGVTDKDFKLAQKIDQI